MTGNSDQKPDGDMTDYESNLSGCDSSLGGSHSGGFLPGFQSLSISEVSAAYLFCIDWDNTFFHGHSHNMLAAMKLPPYQNVSEDTIIKFYETYGIRGNNIALVSKMIANGHYVAITSYTKYSSIIKPILQLAGLTDKEISKIHVVGGFPKDDQLDQPEYDSDLGKQLHIAKAKELFQCQNLPNSRVILIDDTFKNCDIAVRSGYKAYYVEAPNSGDSKAISDFKLNDALTRHGIFNMANSKVVPESVLEPSPLSCSQESELLSSSLSSPLITRPRFATSS